MNKTYHIVYKENSTTDFYATCKNYETVKETEIEKIADVIEQWKKDFPTEQYPNLLFIVLYPLN